MKKKGFLPIFTPIIIVAALIVFGVAYYLGLSKNSSPANNISQQDPNGPYFHKIYSATSKDGLTWQENGQLLFDHASVPGAVIKDGVIYLYFVDASAGQLSVAISRDLGKSFEKKQKVVVKGDNLSYVDPDPVLLDNGKIRLYYFATSVTTGDPSQAGGVHKIMSAESDNGVTFENPKEAFAEVGAVTDPDVFKTSKDWRMFVSKGMSLDLAISSDDGLTFQKQNGFLWNGGGVSDTFSFNGTYRTYFCSSRGGIASATGADTGKLTAESGIRIPITAGQSGIICDPSVVKLPDGNYLMFYKVQEVSQVNQPGRVQK